MILVTRSEQYEGNDVVGVFNNMKKASLAIQRTAHKEGLMVNIPDKPGVGVFETSDSLICFFAQEVEINQNVYVD